VGLAFLFVALIILSAAVVIGLSSYMTPGFAALMTGVILAILGMIMAFSGIRKLKEGVNKPEDVLGH
jgi:putative Mn2+ efflux pump MntP